MPEKILIQFKASGDARLRSSMIKLAASQALLEKNTKQFRKSLTDLTKSFSTHNRRLRNTSGAFSTLRSQMLLFSFAMSLGGRQLAQFGKDAAVLDQMEIAFTTLTGGAENAAIGIEKLRIATDGTMSNFDLFQQANNAMVLGITKNTDEMASMFDMAQRLGKALGVDAKRAVESLVTGIGRQSRLMLDNIGIVVKSEKAYEEHAKKLRKNVSQLTDSEKKQAFLNATLEAARDKLATVGEEQITAGDTLDRFSASMQNLGDRIGESLLPLLTTLAEVLLKIADGFDARMIKSFATAMGILIPITAALAVKFGLLTISATSFMTAIGGTLLLGAIAALGFGINALAKKFGFFKNEQQELERSVFTLTGAIERQVINTKILTMAELEYTLAAKKAELANANKLALSGAYGDSLKNEIKELENQIITNGLWLESYESMSTAQEKFNKMYERTSEGKAEALENDMAAIQMLIDNGINVEKNTVVLKELQDQLDATGTTFGSMAMRAGKAITKMAKDLVTLSAGNKEATIAALELSKAEALVNIVVGATTAVKKGGFFGFIEGLAIIAQGAVMIKQIESQIDAAKAMEQGGLVGGKRHSQGGTLIEAERGEFVMSRNATESIGIENLNRMNRTGGGAGVNINFSGNVLSRDFIEDEAVPLIKDALRKGGDLGIA